MIPRPPNENSFQFLHRVLLQVGCVGDQYNARVWMRVVYAGEDWGYVKTRGLTLPAVGLMTEWVGCSQTDLADTPKTSIDVKATICEDLCVGQAMMAMLGWPCQAIAAATNVGYCFEHHALLSQGMDDQGYVGVGVMTLVTSKKFYMVNGGVGISGCTMHKDAVTPGTFSSLCCLTKPPDTHSVLCNVFPYHTSQFGGRLSSIGR